MLHAAVGREFTIIGEALNRLHKIAPALTDQIPERRSIISFRNILVHGYDIVDDTVVWETIQLDLPQLIRRVEEMLAELGGVFEAESSE